MGLDNLTDTILNVLVFAFVGLLIWLYFKPGPEDDDGNPD